jgi:hypothetical protein
MPAGFLPAQRGGPQRDAGQIVQRRGRNEGGTAYRESPLTGDASGVTAGRVGILSAQTSSVPPGYL